MLKIHRSFNHTIGVKRPIFEAEKLTTPEQNHPVCAQCAYTESDSINYRFTKLWSTLWKNLTISIMEIVGERMTCQRCGISVLEITTGKTIASGLIKPKNTERNSKRYATIPFYE